MFSFRFLDAIIIIPKFSANLAKIIVYSKKSFYLCTRQIVDIALWCNGSTSDSGSACEGSNPSKATIQQHLADFYRLFSFQPMNAAPKVSVMMLTYNHEKYIAEAIRGVVLQKFDHPFELVIGDDCSTDNTLRICREWQQRYPHIIKILERERNIGVHRNLMETLSACTGEYLAKCEGDDYWCNKHKLTRQVEYMEKHPECNVTFHRVINYYSHNNTKSLSNGGQKTDTTINDLSRSNYITNLSVMYRRSVLPQIPSWISEVAAPDYTLHMLHASTGHIHYFATPMAVYRKHSQGMWGVADNEKQLRMAMKSRERLIEHFYDNATVKEGLINTYTSIALSLAVIYEKNSNAEKLAEIKLAILKHQAEWNEDTFLAHLNSRKIQVSAPKESKLISYMRKLRGFISRMMPLPRI